MIGRQMHLQMQMRCLGHSRKSCLRFCLCLGRAGPDLLAIVRLPQTSLVSWRLPAMRSGAAYRHEAFDGLCKCPGPNGILVEGETRVNGYKGWLMSAQSDAMRQAAFRTVQGGQLTAAPVTATTSYCMVGLQGTRIGAD